MSNNQYIAARIHNNSLGTILNVETEERGKQVIRQWVWDQLSRDLTEAEEEGLNNELEFYNDDDLDNVFTFSLGIVEDLDTDEIDAEIELENENKQADDEKTAKRIAG